MGGTEANRYQRCPDLTQTQVRIAKPTQLHSEYTLFFNKDVFFRPRLNILIRLPILGLKYSSIILSL